MKAVGFDLGGTLIRYGDVPLSWESLYSEALREAAEALEIDLTEGALSEAESILLKYNTRVNPRLKEIPANRIFREIQSEWDIERGLKTLKKTFFSYFQRKVECFPDTVETLKTLKDKGLKVGVFTDVPYGMDKGLVKKDINEIEEYIDVLLTSVDVGFRKPSPVIYEELSDRLGVNIDMYVGDEKKDIEGANRADIYSVLLDREGLKEGFGECEKISSLEELVQVLKKFE